MKVFVLAALVAVATAADLSYQKSSYPAAQPAYPAAQPTYPAAAPAYPAASKGYDYPPMPYNFAWAVKDDYYNDYAHQATADDKGYVQGSYRVALPDGRTQIVNYKADAYSGYVADVKYEGEAKYDYKPAYKPAAYSAPASYPAAAPANYPAAPYPSKY